jgi:integrase
MSSSLIPSSKLMALVPAEDARSDFGNAINCNVHGSDPHAINCTTRADIAHAINCTSYRLSVRAINCKLDTANFEACQQAPSRLLDLLSQSISKATKRAYEADMRHYGAFGGHLPSSPDLVALYLASMSETHRPSTIARRLAALGKAHRACGLPDPTKSEIVRATLKGIRREQGSSQTQANPLLKEDLFELLSAMGEAPKDLRDRAFLLIGFAGGLRRSELVALDVSDIEIVRLGIIVHIRRSKTDQDGVGRKIGIPFGRGRWCPVKALERWLQTLESSTGPIFRRVNRHGVILPQRLSGEAVGLVLRERLADIGHSPTGFSGHSLRAGFATSAVIAGALTHKIRAQTGHASDAMLSRYIRDGDMFTNNAAATVL